MSLQPAIHPLIRLVVMVTACAVGVPLLLLWVVNFLRGRRQARRDRRRLRFERGLR